MLEQAVDFLNTKLDELKIVQKIFCLAELVTDAKGMKSPRAYQTKGQWESVSDVDKSMGLSYWRLTGDVSVSANPGSVPCNEEVELSYPLQLIVVLPKSQLSADNAYSEHKLAEALMGTFINSSSGLKLSIGAKRTLIKTTKYSVDGEAIFAGEYSGIAKKDFDYKFAYISLDISLSILINKSCLPQTCI